MSDPAKSVEPDLRSLFALFPQANDIPEYEIVPADEVPEPYHGLLVHEQHMTVSVEAHHGDLVNVRVLERAQTPEWYARRILLALQKTGRVVQFGIMRVHFRYLSSAVRAEILAEKTPLGRILIQHDVLRRIEPSAYLRVLPGPVLMSWFGTQQRPAYGRLAVIHCDEQPAIELLEIVAPG